METYNMVCIPGIFFMSYALYKYVHIFYSACRVNPRMERIIYIGYAAFITLFYFIRSLPLLFFIGNVVALLILILLYEKKPVKALFTATAIHISFMLAEGFFSFIFHVLQPASTSFNPAFPSVLIPVGIHAFLRLIEGLQCLRKNIVIQPVYWISLLSIPLCTLVLVLMALNNLEPDSLSAAVIASAGLSINLVTFYLYDRLSALMDEKLNLTLTHEQSRFYDNQIKMMKNSLEEMDILRHNFKNGLASVNSQLQKDNTEAALAQLSRLASSCDGKKEYVHSGNTVVDVLLNYKLQHMDCEKTALTINTLLPSQLNILDSDMALILGNLLDNALEALVLADEPILSIDIRYTKGCLVICIRNSFDGNLLAAEEHLVSRKENKTCHPGSESIKNTLEKYDGLLELTQENNVLTAEALLYV